MTDTTGNVKWCLFFFDKKTSEVLNKVFPLYATLPGIMISFPYIEML